ncbi:unnamed protein product [Closterium sp. NIES-53]
MLQIEAPAPISRAIRYALSFCAEGDCYRCVPPDPGIAASALGASASGTPPGTAPAEALHTFTLDSGASCCFFRDITTLTPLPAPVSVRLVDPSGGPVVASSSTVLPCPAVPSGSLSGLHLPSFSTNLVSTAALQDAMVTATTPRGSSLYTLATEPPQTLLWHHRLGHPSLPRLRGMHSRLLVSGLPRSLPPLPPSPAPPCLPCVEGRQRAAPHSSSFPPTTAPMQTLHMDVWGPARVNGQGREHYFLLVVDDYTRYTTVFPLRSKGETLLWHHRLGHPSLPRLRGMHSRLLVSGLPRSLPPLSPSPAPPCLPCVEGRQRAAPHSSSFPPTTAPMQTLHMDVWGPARVNGQGREHYFLLVVDDYTRYTTVFPLRSKGEDLPVLRLHSDRGGEFSSDLLRDFCRGEGITESFTLPDSPQQNGIAEHRIGLVMEVARVM